MYMYLMLRCTNRLGQLGGEGGEGGKRQTPSPVTIYCVHYLLKVAMMSIGFARFPVVEAGCAMT